MSNPGLPAGHAFLHVIYEHRSFASCAAASDQLALPGTDPDLQRAANALLPEVGTVVRTALLVHVRNLTDFYCMSRKNEIPHPYPHTSRVFPKKRGGMDLLDVLLEDFDIAPLTGSLLLTFLDSISVHVGHISAWRDEDYRVNNENTGYGNSKDQMWGRTRQRVEWDSVTPTIISEVFTALRHAATPSSATTANAWCTAFSKLHDACVERRDQPAVPWPVELGNKVDVEQYLTSLGLIGGHAGRS